MPRHINALYGASLLLGVSMLAAQAQMVEPTIVPEAPVFDAQGDVTFVGRNDLYEFGSLPEYHEPDWVTANYVDKGLLPPVAERLPPEPMIFKAATMPDGIGEYGDTLRHVIGGRPEGWNWWAGQNHGWGGVEYGLWECLTRTGPLFAVKAEELEPLPNLAQSWEWSEDGHQLTMHLVQGVKWSDGDPFDSEDIMFFWNDHILDSNVAPQGGATREAFGSNTNLEALDANTIRWTFAEVRPELMLYEMSFGRMCPGPSHVLKPQHPKYNSENTYEEYKNAFPPEYLAFPTLGAWVVADYRPEDIIVLRRNPYYWKVDEAGNQLPYLDEVQYKLSTWADRTIQTVAGSGDWSNMEQPQEYVESLRRSAEATAPARLEFGPRIIGWSLELNFGTEGWGDPDERELAVRELNRNLDFRKAVTHGLDRQAIGDSLVRGPFAAIYPGGLYPNTVYYDRESTVYYPFSVETAKAHLEKAGLVDTDGDGYVNFPAGIAGGANVEIALMASNEIGPDRTLSEAVIAQMETIGLRVIADPTQGSVGASRGDSGLFDWRVRRVEREFNTVIQDSSRLAPVGPRTSYWHRAGPDDNLDLLPFEQELVDIVKAFQVEPDAAERVALMQRWQRIFTENVYSVGLSNVPGALIINKRLRNVLPGTPILAFQWAEDSAMRERMFAPKAEQGDYELLAGTLAGF